MSLIVQRHIDASSAAAADQFKLTLQTLQTNFQKAAAVSKLYSNMYILSSSSF